MTNYKVTTNTTTIVKKVTEVVNNSTTYQADDELFHPLKISTRYSGEFLLWIESGATPDFKFQCTLPSGATGYRSDTLIDTIPQATTTLVTAKETGMSCDGSVQQFKILFWIDTSTTPGNLGINWAQNTANGSDTKIFKGSSLTISEMT